METISFIRTLQITDSFFPVGSFAYSDGMETAVDAGLIHDGATLESWMEHFLEQVFVTCEGLAVAKAMSALDSSDFEALVELDQELTAIRPAHSARLASASVGKRLLSLFGAIHDDEHFSHIAGMLPSTNAAVAYAVVFSRSGVTVREAVAAYGYNRLAAMVSAGLRLFSLGQQQGQIILTRLSERLPELAERVLEREDEPLRSFNPILDIQQMNHQYVYSKLFRS